REPLIPYPYRPSQTARTFVTGSLSRVLGASSRLAAGTRARGDQLLLELSLLLVGEDRLTARRRYVVNSWVSSGRRRTGRRPFRRAAGDGRHVAGDQGTRAARKNQPTGNEHARRQDAPRQSPPRLRSPHHVGSISGQSKRPRRLPASSPKCEIAANS